MKKIFSIILCVLLLLSCINSFAQKSKITNRVIYNFQTGDVLESEYNYQFGNVDSPSIARYFRDSIVAKRFFQNNSAVTYTRLRKTITTIIPAPIGYQPTISSFVDSITYNDLDSVPDFYSVLGIVCNQSKYNDTVTADANLCSDTMWQQNFGQFYVCGTQFVCFKQVEYYKGLGGPYYTSQSAISNQNQYNYIVYYKKGSTKCGTPIDFNGLLKTSSGIENNTLETAIKIYPNPVAASFSVEKNAAGKMFFSLYNLLGVKLNYSELENRSTTIQRNDLIAGICFFNISDAAGKIIQSGKIIFE